MSSSSQIYNVGIIGYGLSAKIFHIPFIQYSSRFKLYAVVQRSPTDDNNAEKDYPGIKSYRSTEDLVKDSQVDVVVVTTTPETHHDLAVLCMKAGKNVIVEKPFTTTSSSATSVVKTASDANVLLAVYQNRRFDADFLTLKSLLTTNRLGRVAEFETHFDRHRPDPPAAKTWKTDPLTYSARFDLGTHLLDQVVHLFGMPDRITGFTTPQRIGDTDGLEDSFTCLLHYDHANTTVDVSTVEQRREAGPLLITAKAGVISPETDQLRFWVRGTKGGFKKYHLDPQEDQLKQGRRPGGEGFGGESEDRWGKLNVVDDNGKIRSEQIEPKKGGYSMFYDGFAKALDAEKEQKGNGNKVLKNNMVATGQEAADVIRLIELMGESSKQGKTLEVKG